MAGIYDFTATSLAGEEVPLRRYEGQVLLTVNTASACGFTPQYRGLEALQKELGPRGFSVLGFPCNQFGSQEPGDAKAIEEFCASNYAVTFPMFAKIDVNGFRVHPLYQYLKREKRRQERPIDRPFDGPIARPSVDRSEKPLLQRGRAGARCRHSLQGRRK